MRELKSDFMHVTIFTNLTRRWAAMNPAINLYWLVVYQKKVGLNVLTDLGHPLQVNRRAFWLFIIHRETRMDSNAKIQNYDKVQSLDSSRTHFLCLLSIRIQRLSAVVMEMDAHSNQSHRCLMDGDSLSRPSQDRFRSISSGNIKQSSKFA